MTSRVEGVVLGWGGTRRRAGRLGTLLKTARADVN